MSGLFCLRRAFLRLWLFVGGFQRTLSVMAEHFEQVKCKPMNRGFGKYSHRWLQPNNWCEMHTLSLTQKERCGSGCPNSAGGKTYAISPPYNGFRFSESVRHQMSRHLFSIIAILHDRPHRRHGPLVPALAGGNS